MIKLENWEITGWEHAVRGMRNPKNSWDKSNSFYDYGGNYHLGVDDLKLAKALASGGSDDRKFLRMISVYVDIIAPLYWWKEFDTYKVGTVSDSCSTMHKIQAKEFTLNDFSCEHIKDLYVEDGGCECEEYHFISSLTHTINDLNIARKMYLKTKDKTYWWQMIQLLPSSYNQKRTIMLNYEVLKNMYHARKNHKLDEWHAFCDWIETLPYSELIVGEK